jgi:hypothetical protein
MGVRKSPLWLLGLALVITGSSVFGALFQKQVDRSQGTDLTRFPIVEYSAPLPSDPTERAKRQANSRKYNSKHAPAISESTDTIFYISDWDSRLPALPVVKSAAIAVGQITQARGYLSEDQTDVYSEFTIRVDEVLKNENQNTNSVGEILVAERKGGRVRLPSGKIAVSLVNHQDMPRVGSRYVLFLTHNFPLGGQIEDYYLLTGYELRGGHVFPLDNVPPGHPIAAYNGVDEMLFMADLRVAVAKID